MHEPAGEPQRRPAADADARHGVARRGRGCMMIDELSLGLAPSIVAELLRVVQALKEQGTTVILVEQSVNVALTVAETAYFMEKGEIRFHGPTSELLERPDVLRSVFLEGAASVELDADGPAIVHVSEAAVTAGRGDRGAGRQRLARRPAPERARRVEALRRHQRAHRRVVRRRRRRGPRLPRSERRGQDDAVRRDLRLPARRPGRRAPRRRLHRRPRPATRAAAPRARAFVPGRPAVPRADREGDDRGRARAQHRRARPGRGRAAPARRSPTRRRRCGRASRS